MSKNEKLIEEVYELHADICSALADPKRILILYALYKQTLSVNDLANTIGATQPATSRHLKILRERGLVSAERQGMNIEYSLMDERLIQALELLRDVMRTRFEHQALLLQNQ